MGHTHALEKHLRYILNVAKYSQTPRVVIETNASSFTDENTRDIEVVYAKDHT